MEHDCSEATFSLVDHPWIPCRDRHGRSNELGIGEVLRRSHELAGISGEIPTQVFATTRLLLAVLHAALDGPRDAAEWRGLWEAETLPFELIETYLGTHRHRFDLLHPEHPFFQVADLQTAKGETSELEKLISDVPNGKPFFSTRLGGGLDLSYAEAARWLVHCQAFDPSGIKSGCEGDDRVKAGKGYPIGVAWSGLLGGVLAEGATLKETLLLNLLARTTEPFVRAAPGDVAAWEREPDTAAERDDAEPTGPLDLYTWQSRRVRLVAESGRVRRVLIGNGDRLTPQDMHEREPHSGWRRSDAQAKKLGRSTVYMPKEHDPSRAIWRGLESMLPRGTTGPTSEARRYLSPPLLDWHAELVDERHLARDQPVRLRTIGMVYGSQSSVTAEVVDDALSVRALLLSRAEHLVAAATSCVSAADAAAFALGKLAANLAVAAGGDPDGPRGRATEAAYAELDRPFRRWLAALDTATTSVDAQTEWHETARRIVTDLAVDEQKRSPMEAWSGRLDRRGRLVTSSHADIWFRRALRTALPYAFPAHSEAAS